MIEETLGDVNLSAYLIDLQNRFYDDPVGFTRYIFGVEPTWQQVEIMNAVAKYKKVSVRSGHNIGKSALATWLNYWFMATRMQPKIICSATNKEQLEDVLWAEMAKWMRHSALMETLFEWQKHSVYGRWNPAESWAVARTVSKGEGIVGRHADNMMLIFDEVSGMDDSILTASEGLMSGKNVYILLISNPTRDSGFFYETQTSDRLADYWHPLHYSSLDSPLLDKAWLDYMLMKYGEDSNVYRVKVLGEFPYDTKDCLIPREWILGAVDKPLEPEEWMPRIMGGDVGAGGDKSVLLGRHGPIVQKIIRNNISDSTELAKVWADEYYKYNADAICVDSIGVGWGVYNILKRMGLNVFSVDVRRRSYKRQFDNLRDELCWKCREQFESGNVSIPDDEDLKLESWSVKYTMSGEKMKIQNKAQMRLKAPRGIGRSPDTFDAYMLSNFLDDHTFVKIDRSKYDPEEEYDRARENRLMSSGRNPMTGY